MKEKRVEDAEKYGVMKTIPERKIEEEEVEVKKSKVKEESIPELLLRIEKLDGRFEVLNSFRKVTEERMVQLAEEIGELRSLLLDFEKRFSPLEANVERLIKEVKEVRPEEIKKLLRKNEERMLEIEAEIEKNREAIKSLKKGSARLTETLEKIKNVENILEISRNVEEKLRRIEETKAYVDRVAGKVDVIFSELRDKLAKFETNVDKIKKLDELSVDIVRSLDEMSIKIQKFLEKEKVEKLIESKLKGLSLPTGSVDLRNEIQKIREEVGKLARSMEEVKLETALLRSISSIAITSDPGTIQRNLSRIRGIVSRMIQLKIWDESKKQELLSMLEELANTWEYYGRGELAEVYRAESRYYA